LNLNAGATAQVQISVDGGLTFSNLPIPWSAGPTNYGNPNNGFQQVSDRSQQPTTGQSNVRVRFFYTGNTGSNWAVDNVRLTGTYQPVTYQWSPTTYLNPADGASRIETTTPAVTGPFNIVL
jgi:hypothetical protein